MSVGLSLYMFLCLCQDCNLELAVGDTLALHSYGDLWDFGYPLGLHMEVLFDSYGVLWDVYETLDSKSTDRRHLISLRGDSG